MFTDDGGILVCADAGVESSDAFFEFKHRHATPCAPGEELPPDAKLLFRVTVEQDGSKAKAKPVVYAGIAHTASFTQALELFDRKFPSEKGGAFLLEGGYGANHRQNAANVFMKYGHELSFHTNVDQARVAWHPRS